jgi:ABC-type branched-subunit amino acid transport system substrate-binding protein
MAEPASRSVVTVVSSVTGILPEIDDKALLVRMAPSDAAQARALGKVLAGRVPRIAACKGVAVVSAEGAWGQGFAGALLAELDSAGVRAVAHVRVPMTPKRSYAEDLAQVAAAKADCEVVLVPAAVAARYLVDAGRRPGLRVFAGDTVANGDFLLKARIDRADPKAGSVADGVRGVHFARPADSRPERRFFVRKYREVAGADPTEDFAATQFDAVVVLALALERNGLEVQPQALRDSMRALTQGKIAFGPEDLDLAMQHARRGEDVDYRGASGDVDDQGNGTFVTFGIEGGVLTDLAPVP